MKPLPDELVIPVRVQPRGSVNRIEGVTEGRLRIRTTAPPADGRANKDVARQLAREFRVPASRVSLKRGASGRLKTFVIEKPEYLPDWVSGISFR